MTDPALSPAEGGDYLTARYSKEKGESIVYGGVLAAGALLLFGVPRAPVISILAALAALGVAFYHWPYVARERRALAISPAGVAIDRLGLLPWNAISDARLLERFVRQIRNAELRIALRRSIETAVENPISQNYLQRAMYRCWSIVSPREIAVKLSTLDAKPEAIMAAMREHIQRPV